MAHTRKSIFSSETSNVFFHTDNGEKGERGKNGKSLAESAIVDSSMCEADGEGKKY